MDLPSVDVSEARLPQLGRSHMRRPFCGATNEAGSGPSASVFGSKMARSVSCLAGVSGTKNSITLAWLIASRVVAD